MTIKEPEIQYAPVTSAITNMVDAYIPVAQPVSSYSVPVATAAPLPSKVSPAPLPNKFSPNVTVTAGQWVEDSASGKMNAPGPTINYDQNGRVQSGTFHCSKCKDPYDLPRGATSWRCPACHQFNNTAREECVIS